MKFEIINIVTERSIVGKSSISARCLKDNVKVSIVVPNRLLTDRDKIKEKLIENHANLIKIIEEGKLKSSKINIGEII